MNINLVKRFFLFLILANVLNTILAIIAAFFNYSFENSFVTLFLFEGGIILTYGGFQELEGTVLMSQIKKEVFKRGKGYSPENHKRGREKANFFIGIGVFLVCESVFLSLLLLVNSMR